MNNYRDQRKITPTSTLIHRRNKQTNKRTNEQCIADFISINKDFRNYCFAQTTNERYEQANAVELLDSRQRSTGHYLVTTGRYSQKHYITPHCGGETDPITGECLS